MRTVSPPQWNPGIDHDALIPLQTRDNFHFGAESWPIVIGLSSALLLFTTTMRSPHSGKAEYPLGS